MSNRFPSVQASSDGKSSDGGRLLQVTNTCEAAVGERVQCCDRENSKRAFVRSEDADGSAIARLASFEGKSMHGVAPMMLARPTMHQTARFVQRSDRRNSGRVRILQQASVMLGHCRMRSRSKPQLHARSAVGSSGPDEPRGWAGGGLQREQWVSAP